MLPGPTTDSPLSFTSINRTPAGQVPDTLNWSRSSTIRPVVSVALGGLVTSPPTTAARTALALARPPAAALVGCIVIKPAGPLRY